MGTVEVQSIDPLPNPPDGEHVGLSQARKGVTALPTFSLSENKPLKPISGLFSSSALCHPWYS
jgi:hypothetical protein